MTRAPRYASGTAADVPTNRRRGGFVRETLKLPAAVVAVVMVAPLLTVLFGDGPNDGQHVERFARSGQPAVGDAPHGELLAPLRPDGRWLRLFVVPANGSPSRQLIPEGTIEGDQWEGVWSPDGSQVAVTIRNGSSSDIYLVNADGSEFKQLTPAITERIPRDWAFSQNSPDWSPDGSTIAFSSNRGFDSGGQDIYAINVDSSNLRRLTDDEDWEGGPRWSPDGARIALEAIGYSRGDYGTILIMNADGTDRRQLVEATGAGQPNWSSNGEWIAYSAGRLRHSMHIIRPDGTGQRDLASGTLFGNWPRWSPNGATLAWSAHDEGGSFDGLAIHDLTSGETRLINGIFGKIDWSPDGKWISVAMPEIDVSGRETGAGGLYLVRPDGSERVLLQEIQIDEFDMMLDWSPAPTDSGTN